MLKLKKFLDFKLCFQLGQSIRLLLAYTGTEVEEQHYELGPGMDRSDWLKVKFTLGLDFPNLPYYIDGKCLIFLYSLSSYEASNILVHGK